METETKDLEKQETTETENEPTKEDEAAVATEEESTETTEEEVLDQEKEATQEATKSQDNKRFAEARVSNRMRKLKGDVSTAQAGQEETAQKLAIEQEKSKILQLALDQQKEKSVPNVIPNPDNFDSGVHDPEYIKQHLDYQQRVTNEQVRKQVEEATTKIRNQASQDTFVRETEMRQRDHYRRTLDNGNKDYEETEDVAIERLGVSTVKEIINNFPDDSDRIIYRLGKDSKLAGEVADAIALNKTVLAIRLLERASGADFKPKPKTKTTPDPDTEISGGSPSGASDTDAVAIKLLNAAEKTGSKASLNKYLDYMAERRKQSGGG